MLLCLAGAVKYAVASHLYSLERKEDRIGIEPSLPACSKPGENCYSTGCCQVSGHECFTRWPGRAQCNETCTVGEAGFTCEIVSPHSVPVVRPLGQKLYCFSVYTKDTGNAADPNNEELELLKAQFRNGVSIFTCEQWDVFSDVSVFLGHDTHEATIRVDDVLGEFHQVKTQETGTWVNWGLFYQVWIKIREVGKWEQTDYTVKVDADAVFVPERLRDWLSTVKGDSQHGMYFENCKNVQYGFFGHLEVLSNTATRVLTQYLENCHAEFAPCANTGCDWNSGAWGEDMFAQRCMDHHYVDKVEAFNTTTNGACKADRPDGQKENTKWHPKDCSKVTTAAAHPFKRPQDYLQCMGEMTGKVYNDKSKGFLDRADLFWTVDHPFES